MTAILVGARAQDRDDLAIVESADDLAVKPAQVERSPGWVGDHASLGGCDWRGERERRHNEFGKHRPTKHPPNRSRLGDRHAYFKRNSGGCVIFGWNCALQDVTS
jgi:sugar lactone lactonase YvrE